MKENSGRREVESWKKLAGKADRLQLCCWRIFSCLRGSRFAVVLLPPPQLLLVAELQSQYQYYHWWELLYTQSVGYTS